MNVPRIVVAGTQSGVGKTSITLGLIVLLRRRGLKVQTFKVGPDYLDATYLALASGRPCYNLDGWMTSQEYVCRLFVRTCQGADIAVVEGVMGLFDGADADARAGSTAEVAYWLKAPVVLVVDAHGMGRSLAPMVHGYASFDPEIHVAGVIANRCGSQRHAEGLAASLRSASLPPLLGAVRRGALPELASRHLGLVTADERRLSEATLDELGDGLAQGLSLDTVLHAVQETPASVVIPSEARDLLSPASHMSREEQENSRSLATLGMTNSQVASSQMTNLRANVPPRVRLGIARDEAFHFYYPDNLEALSGLGCELVPFSPVRDAALPAGLQGLYFGGGYPEEYAAALAANYGMLAGIREFAAAGGVIYAECGGLMYVSQGIETLEGKRHALLGLLPVWTRMCPRRQSLGYVEVTLTADSLWGRRGERLRGHEFHYSQTVEPPDWETAYAVRYRRSETVRQEGFQQGNILASYVHLHFASQPRAVESFVGKLREGVADLAEGQVEGIG